MIATSRAAARPIARTGRTLATALGLLGMLAALTACAAGNATSSLAAPSPASASSAPAAAPATAPPRHLTTTEINERCWMGTEKYKTDDIDKRMKQVDKCVDDMKRAQGGG